MNLPQFLNSISIEAAGEVTFNLMIEEGYDTVEKINAMTVQQIADVGKTSKKTIGEKTAEKIWNSLHSNRVKALLIYENLWVNEPTMKDIADAFKRAETPTGMMPDQIAFIVKDGVSLQDHLGINVEGESELKIDVRGKKVLFTGTGPFSRSALTSILKRNGAIVQKAVTKETEILILESLESTSNKAKKARKYGTKMVTYSDVFGE